MTEAELQNLIAFLAETPTVVRQLFGELSTDEARPPHNAWWLATLPGLAISLVVLGANLLGDGLRDLLDPRLRT